MAIEVLPDNGERTPRLTERTAEDGKIGGEDGKDDTSSKAERNGIIKCVTSLGFCCYSILQ